MIDVPWILFKGSRHFADFGTAENYKPVEKEGEDKEHTHTLHEPKSAMEHQSIPKGNLTMKRLYLLVLVVMLMGVSACSAPASTPAADDSAGASAETTTTESTTTESTLTQPGDIPRPEACDSENPFIAVALPNLTNPYYVAMKQGFEDAAAEAGFDAEVQVANNDDAEQLAQVQAMLQKNPCALALNGVKSEPAAAW